MHFKNMMIALSLFLCASLIHAVPQYRLVSGTRGVIFSIENIDEEPDVQVELIDGNLSVNIQDSSKISHFSKKIHLPQKFWADSLIATYGEGSAHLFFYNFRLSIEDMQKKYTNSRLLLLISPMKSEKFSKELFEKNKVPMPSISDVSITNRDGLEFITLAGDNLGNAEISRMGESVIVTFADGLEKISEYNINSESFLTDSIGYFVTDEGLTGIKLYQKSGDGYLSLMERKANLLKFIFVDNREKDNEEVFTWNESGELSFVVNRNNDFEDNSPEAGDISENLVDESENLVDESENLVDKSENLVDESDIESSLSGPSESVLYNVLYLVKNDVNVRSTPDTKNSENIIGCFPYGTRMVSNEKNGAWYKVLIDDTINGWVYKTLVEDSINITDSQWDAIYNQKAVDDEAAPVLDEFNSPGTDPLLADNKSDVFSIDSIKDEMSDDFDSSDMMDEPELAVKEEVIIKPYKKHGRDPFLPLTNSDFLKPKLPKVDQLTLVGVIYDPQQGVALFEELVEGDLVSFSMRAGEKVENGKLLRIYERKVVFLMRESDISFTVEKELLDKKE